MILEGINVRKKLFNTAKKMGKMNKLMRVQMLIGTRRCVKLQLNGWGKQSKHLFKK
jgi:hypothetical protein